MITKLTNIIKKTFIIKILYSVLYFRNFEYYYIIIHKIENILCNYIYFYNMKFQSTSNYNSLKTYFKIKIFMLHNPIIF